jgi:hypothetical protein
MWDRRDMKFKARLEPQLKFYKIMAVPTAYMKLAIFSDQRSAGHAVISVKEE